jgi:ABC-2 type transport system ATP-binding protein
MLSLVGLNPDAAHRNVGTYSLGMRQRLSLAAALLCDPFVLILDEPGNGLDPQGIRTLRNLLRARAENGDTVLVSSHLLSEVEHLVDDVIVIDRGRPITSGTIHDLQNTASLVRTASAKQFKDVLESTGIVAELQDAHTLLIRGLPIEEIGERAFSAGFVLHELSRHSGSLEDLFLDWTRGDADEKEVTHL